MKKLDKSARRLVAIEMTHRLAGHYLHVEHTATDSLHHLQTQSLVS